jgi:porphobilinogen synthase
MTTFPTARDRRLRRTPAIRRLVAETRLHPASLVLPMFVVPGEGVDRPITSMPGHSQLSVDRLVPVVEQAAELGIGGVMLFGVPAEKDEEGSGGWDPDGPVPSAIRAIRDLDLTVWADVCLCEYTSHGHCGVLTSEGAVDNDATLPLLARAAVAYAEAGADVIAPSDMMDGRVAAIRTALDGAGFPELAICSYAVKYASAYYGPFREAAESAPAFGDRRSHQMDAATRRQAVGEVRRDLVEGADMVMVKPAGPYQDVISLVRSEVDVPVAAYQVSGEFSMIEAAAANGWVDREGVMMESLTGIARAGADIILTYFALDVARVLGRRSEVGGRRS